MRPQLTLSLKDERGRSRHVTVECARFTIGRAQDNDLVIDDPGLSRRHALIESFDGIIQISDCGSQNGTFVNGGPVAGATVLKDGDVIMAGRSCEIGVSLDANCLGPQVAPGHENGPDAQAEPDADDPASLAVAARPSKMGLTSAPVIASAALAAVLIASIALVLLNRGGSRGRVVNTTVEALPAGASAANREVAASKAPEAEARSQADAISIRQINRLAVEVMRRVSRDEKRYDFSEKALGEIKKKVEQYSSSPALLDGLRAIRQGGQEVAAQVQRGAAMEPPLVIYTALAEAVSRRAGREVAAIARDVYKEMLAIRVDYGSDEADACLLDVAVYKMKSRSLASSLARAVKNSSRDRNVWYLHEKGELDDEAYDFVLSFLAVGVIAQNPGQFGVASETLPF
ncbi:MAG TPA: FHA domain-containing protein [Blastocatellia bacterium]|jgi:hypothetical protein|nr:FHA domain-containing protein [Blastocatellia bacterium]